MGITSSVVCLLPARNAAADLAGYLASVERFGDAIVALDDGSTDDTRDLLSASPLVRVLLTSPLRNDDADGDDAAKRNRLLDAAAELDPEWIISLDADERIDPDDATALRDFLRADAIPGCAYGFRQYRMWGDDAYDPRFKWVFRLFGYAPGQQFPTDQLHFSPIPTSIPPERWLTTTIRIKRHVDPAGIHVEASRVGRVIQGQGSYLRWPVSGRIFQGYGWRQHPIRGDRSLHTGVDIRATIGTPVRAAAAGQVLFSGDRGRFGSVVLLDHGDSLTTLYAHLDRIDVRSNDRVEALSTIGTVGMTGMTTGPHLHFEVRVGGEARDPVDWI